MVAGGNRLYFGVTAVNATASYRIAHSSRDPADVRARRRWSIGSRSTIAGLTLLTCLGASGFGFLRADSPTGKIDAFGALARAPRGLELADDAGAVAEAADPSCRDCQVGELAIGTQATASLAEDDCTLEDGSRFHVWLVVAEESTSIRVSLRSTSFDTFLMLADANCLVLDFDDDCVAGDTTESCLELTVPPGEYFLVANGLTANETGEYRLRVTNTSRTGTLFRRADANSSGRSDISDAIYVLTFLFLGGPAPECMKAADMDDSGIVNITDATYLLNALFLDGPPVPEPWEECGTDPSEDAIECASHAPCA